MDKLQFIAELAKLRTSSTFLTLVGYRNEYSELADYSIVFHIDYQKTVERSISVLENIVPANPLEVAAKQELLTSFRRSIKKAKETPVEEIDDAYTRFFDSDGSYIKGVKMHTATGILHLYGLVVHKRIIMPGLYPDSSGSDFAKAKRHLRFQTPVGKFRQFRITPFQVERVSVENLSLLPPQ